MYTDVEIYKIEVATLYDLRCTISESEKGSYQKEEILELIDRNAEKILKLLDKAELAKK